MKKTYLIVFALLFSVLACNIKEVKKPAINQTSKISKISVKENSFIKEDGTPIVFRGVSTSDPDKLEKEGHWNLNYFREMKQWGATLTRFPVHPKAWRERGKEAYLKILDDGVKWATEVGLYIIIDWHSIGNLHENKYFMPMYETSIEETQDFWITMANHYTHNNTVAFFELFNEPTLYNGTLGTCSWSDWKLINENLIALIRKNGCDAIPLVAGFNWAYDLTPIKEFPINAEGIGYVSHPYPQKREKPWEAQWTEDWGFVADKYPLILTEMGFCGPNDKGAHIPVISDESYGDAITKYADEKGISYMVWVFDPDWSPMMFTDWDFTPSRQGIYFKKILQAYHNHND